MQTPSERAVSLDDVDVVVKTFMRPALLAGLIASIERYYPGVGVHIADDSPATEATRAAHRAMERRGHIVHALPFDVGLSAGRNHLVDATSRPFVLVLDDDFVFADTTRIESLLEVARCRPDVGVIAGLVVDLGGAGVDRGARRFEQDALGIMHLLPAAQSVTVAGHGCQPADMVGNFGLFRRRLLDEVRWDPFLKVNEHFDFFMRVARSGWGVLAVPDVVVGHAVHRDAAYAAYRHRRGTLYRARSLDKAGLLEVCSHVGSPDRVRRNLLTANLAAASRAVSARQWRRAAEAAWVAVRHIEPSGSGIAFALRIVLGVAKRRAIVMRGAQPRADVTSGGSRGPR